MVRDAYTASDNAPARTRVWPCETKGRIGVNAYIASMSLNCLFLQRWPVGSIRVFVYIICCIVHYLVSVVLFVFVVVFVPCDCVIVLLLFVLLLFLSFR